MGAKGDIMFYVYDLQCGWIHEITVLELFPESSSTGGVQVLGGEWACPPEDALGQPHRSCLSYFEAMVRKTLVNEEAQRALNVHPNHPYDPLRFSLPETVKR